LGSDSPALFSQLRRALERVTTEPVKGGKIQYLFSPDKSAPTWIEGKVQSVNKDGSVRINLGKQLGTVTAKPGRFKVDPPQLGDTVQVGGKDATVVEETADGYVVQTDVGTFPVGLEAMTVATDAPVVEDAEPEVAEEIPAAPESTVEPPAPDATRPIGAGVPPASGVVVANIGADGKIYYGKPGETHADLSMQFGAELRESEELKPGEGTWDNQGFADNTGRFLSREEALEVVRSENQGFQSNLGDELDAADLAEQGPRAVAREVTDETDTEAAEPPAATPAATDTTVEPTEQPVAEEFPDLAEFRNKAKTAPVTIDELKSYLEEQGAVPDGYELKKSADKTSLVNLAIAVQAGDEIDGADFTGREGALKKTPKRPARPKTEQPTDTDQPAETEQPTETVEELAAQQDAQDTRRVRPQEIAGKATVAGDALKAATAPTEEQELPFQFSGQAIAEMSAERIDEVVAELLKGLDEDSRAYAQEDFADLASKKGSGGTASPATKEGRTKRRRQALTNLLIRMGRHADYSLPRGGVQIGQYWKNVNDKAMYVVKSVDGDQIVLSPLKGGEDIALTRLTELITEFHNRSEFELQPGDVQTELERLEKEFADALTRNGNEDAAEQAQIAAAIVKQMMRGRRGAAFALQRLKAFVSSALSDAEVNAAMRSAQRNWTIETTDAYSRYLNDSRRPGEYPGRRFANRVEMERFFEELGPRVTSVTVNLPPRLDRLRQLGFPKNMGDIRTATGLAGPAQALQKIIKRDLDELAEQSGNETGFIIDRLKVDGDVTTGIKDLIEYLTANPLQVTIEKQSAPSRFLTIDDLAEPQANVITSEQYREILQVIRLDYPTLGHDGVLAEAAQRLAAGNFEGVRVRSGEVDSYYVLDAPQDDFLFQRDGEIPRYYTVDELNTLTKGKVEALLKEELAPLEKRIATLKKEIKGLKRQNAKDARQRKIEKLNDQIREARRLHDPEEFARQKEEHFRPRAPKLDEIALPHSEVENTARQVFAETESPTSQDLSRIPGAPKPREGNDKHGVPYAQGLDRDKSGKAVAPTDYATLKKWLQTAIDEGAELDWYSNFGSETQNLVGDANMNEFAVIFGITSAKKAAEVNFAETLHIMDLARRIDPNKNPEEFKQALWKAQGTKDNRIGRPDLGAKGTEPNLGITQKQVDQILDYYKTGQYAGGLKVSTYMWNVIDKAGNNYSPFTVQDVHMSRVFGWGPRKKYEYYTVNKKGKEVESNFKAWKAKGGNKDGNPVKFRVVDDAAFPRDKNIRYAMYMTSKLAGEFGITPQQAQAGLWFYAKNNLSPKEGDGLEGTWESTTQFAQKGIARVRQMIKDGEWNKDTPLYEGLDTQPTPFRNATSVEKSRTKKIKEIREALKTAKGAEKTKLLKDLEVNIEAHKEAMERGWSNAYFRDDVTAVALAQSPQAVLSFAPGQARGFGFPENTTLEELVEYQRSVLKAITDDAGRIRILHELGIPHTISETMGTYGRLIPTYLITMSPGTDMETANMVANIMGDAMFQFSAIASRPDPQGPKWAAHVEKGDGTEYTQEELEQIYVHLNRAKDPDGRNFTLSADGRSLMFLDNEMIEYQIKFGDSEGRARYGEPETVAYLNSLTSDLIDLPIDLDIRMAGVESHYHVHETNNNGRIETYQTRAEHFAALSGSPRRSSLLLARANDLLYKPVWNAYQGHLAKRGRTPEDATTILASLRLARRSPDDRAWNIRRAGKSVGGPLLVGDRLRLSDAVAESLAYIGGTGSQKYNAPEMVVSTPGDFRKAISAAAAASPAGQALYIYDESDYKDMTLFMSDDGMAGFALKGDDIVSVFKHPKSPYRAVTIPMMRLAIEQGGRRLDAFDAGLATLYARSGFSVASRLRWDDEQADPNWNKANPLFASSSDSKWSTDGEPDVVFMYYNPETTGLYFNEGEYASDYGAALEEQSAAVERSRDYVPDTDAGPERPSLSRPKVPMILTSEGVKLGKRHIAVDGARLEQTSDFLGQREIEHRVVHNLEELQDLTAARGDTATVSNMEVGDLKEVVPRIAEMIPNGTVYVSTVMDPALGLQLESVGDSRNSDNLGQLYKAPDAVEQMQEGLTPGKTPKIQTNRSPDLEGQGVGLRIDIPFFKKTGEYVVTVHKGATKSVGPVLGYDSIARLSGAVQFQADIEKLQSVHIELGQKTPFATVAGSYAHDYSIPADLDTAWTPVGFDPDKAVFFYDKRTGQEVVTGTDAVSVGNTVFTRNPQYGERSAFNESRVAILSKGRERTVQETQAILEEHFDTVEVSETFVSASNPKPQPLFEVREVDEYRPPLYQRDEATGLQAQRDAEYMDAVKNGDMETAQRMVDEAAKDAGYTTLGYHVSKDSFNIFSREQSNTGFWFADNEKAARNFYTTLRQESPTAPPPVVYRAYLKIENPEKFDDFWHDFADSTMRSRMPGSGVPTREEYVRMLERQGRDGMVIGDDVWMDAGPASVGEQFVTFRPEQIKSSDPVTRDDAGNVIPLSQRFDATDPNILYQKGDMRDRGATALPGSRSGSKIRGAFDYSAGHHRAVIGIFEQNGGDFGTLIHELGHFFRTQLTRSENIHIERIIEKELGKSPLDRDSSVRGGWTVEAEEFFAEQFQRYVGSGKTDVQELQGVFAKLKRWLSTVIFGIKNKHELSPEVRSFFDSMLSGEERTALSQSVASDRRLAQAIAANEPLPEFAAEVDAIEAFTTLGGLEDWPGNTEQPQKNKLKFLQARGNLPRPVWNRLRKMRSTIAGAKRSVELAKASIQKSVKQELGGMDEANNLLMNDFLSSPEESVRLNAERKLERAAPKTLKQLRNIRTKISAMSQVLIDEKILDEEKVLASIDANLDIYLNRSYRFFEDQANWTHKYVRENHPEIWNDAVDFVRSQSDSEAVGGIVRIKVEGSELPVRARVLKVNEEEGTHDIEYVVDGKKETVASNRVSTLSDKNAHQIVSDLLTHGGSGGIGLKTILGAKNLDILKKRKEIPVEIRRLWGEYENVDDKIVSTMFKMQKLMAEQTFLTDLRKNATGTLFFEEDTQPVGEGKFPSISAKDNPKLGPLQGLRTYDWLLEELERHYSPQSEDNLALDTMKRLSLLTKVGNTVYSVGTQLKNFVSNVGIQIASGNWDATKFFGAGRTIIDDWANTSDADRAAYIKELYSLGVIDGGVSLKEVMSGLDDASASGIADYINKKPGLRAVKKGVVDVPMEIYKAGDTVWRIYAFENFKKRYRPAFPDMEEADLNEYAAQLVYEETPSAAAADSSLLKLLRGLPMGSTFITFTAEMYRVTGNQVRRAVKELASDNPVLRRSGFKRLLGLSAAMDLTGIIGWGSVNALMGALLGAEMPDDDEQEDYWATGRSWFDGSQFLKYPPIFKKNEKGEVTNVILRQFQFENAHSYGGIRNVVTAVLRGVRNNEGLDMVSGVATNVAGAVADQFLEGQMATELVFELMNNRDDYGNEIVEQVGDDAGLGSVLFTTEGLSHVLGKTFGGVRQFTKLVNTAYPAKGHEFDHPGQLRDATLSFFGMTHNYTDLNKTVMRAAGDLKYKQRNATKGAIYDVSKGTSPEEAYGKANEFLKELEDHTRKVFSAAERLGMSPEEIDRIHGVKKGEEREISKPLAISIQQVTEGGALLSSFKNNPEGVLGLADLIHQDNEESATRDQVILGMALQGATYAMGQIPNVDTGWSTRKAFSKDDRRKIGKL
jgi:hypothetical protein